MRAAIRHEMKKVMAYGNYRTALLLGLAAVAAHFVSVADCVKRLYFSDVGSMRHPTGLDNISLLIHILPADNWSVTAFLFYLVLPALAAFPFGASLHKERKSGYQLQVITRVGKRRYLLAKLLAAAASGFTTVFVLLVLDMMLCATICPLAPVHVLSLVAGVGQGSFAAPLFYNYPALYVAAAILMSSLWGAVCAVVALASEMYISNAFLIAASPLVLLLALTMAMEFLEESVIHTDYEFRPLSLMTAAPMNRNPSWYIFLWQCGFALPAAVMYSKKGMGRENL